VDTFRVDIAGEKMQIEHYWRRCVGSGHAALGLREDWRNQLRKCHDELGFEYVRFHGLLNDDMSVCAEYEGKMQYSFHNVDSIFDFLLDIGMKPFVELSFMPGILASGNQTIFHYKSNVTVPKDFKLWKELVCNLVHHLVTRYGIDEVRKWFFEVWNEPNLPPFWAGSQQEYFLLYQNAAEAIKKIDPNIKVGGPATARNAWITEFVDFCSTNKVPLDFISTHHYPTDTALGLEYDMVEEMTRAERGILTKMAHKARKEAGQLPLYYTEWSNSPGSRDPYHDEPYCAAFAVKTIVDNFGVIDMYSFWTFSDIFEEGPMSSLPFHGGFGLLTLHGICKPVYRAFELLKRTGKRCCKIIKQGESAVEAFASQDGNKLMILFFNHQPPLSPVKDDEIEVFVAGIEHREFATLERVDHQHANAKSCWIEMGKPEYLNAKQIEELHESSKIIPEKIKCDKVDGSIVFKLKIPTQGVAAVSFDL
jgi:xylan 1,4-beta-xylosidase